MIYSSMLLDVGPKICAAFALRRAKTHLLFPQAEHCDIDTLFFKILTTKDTSSMLSTSRATFMTSLTSLEPNSCQTFFAMKAAVYISKFSFPSLLTAIRTNSSKVYSGISNTRNLDNSGSFILSGLLALANTQDTSSNCLVFLTLVSDIIPVSIKCSSETWSFPFILSNSSINRYFGSFSNNWLTRPAFVVLLPTVKYDFLIVYIISVKNIVLAQPGFPAKSTWTGFLDSIALFRINLVSTLPTMFSKLHLLTENVLLATEFKICFNSFIISLLPPFLALRQSDCKASGN